MYSIFLDLAPILVNWSDILEYGSQFGRIWAIVHLKEFALKLERFEQAILLLPGAANPICG